MSVRGSTGKVWIGEKNDGGSGGASRRLYASRIHGQSRIEQTNRISSYFDSSSRSRAAIQRMRSVTWPGGGGGIAARIAAANRSGLTRFRAYGSGKVPVTETNRGVSRSMNSRAIRSPRAVRSAAITP